MERNYDRVQLRFMLDATPDFSLDKASVSFVQRFETYELPETYFRATDDVIGKGRLLLTTDIVDTIAKTVRDVVTIRIGGNDIPLFALENGGRGRTLSSFRCVYDGCSAFLDVRTFSAAHKIKWVLMGVSHSHTFSSFPSRTPRCPFSQEVVASVKMMAASNNSCAAIKMKLGIVCSDDAFQNLLRNARRDAKAGQARALRDTVALSPTWSSEIHLSNTNAFVEAFFVNTTLIVKRLDVSLVFVDDTACTNMFTLPMLTVLCRDAAGQTHALAWGLLKNRASKSLRRFFAFMFSRCPLIRTFVCDRHYGQRRAILDVYGVGGRIFHCCIHVARNIASNDGPNSDLASRFWEMRFQRTPETEARFLEALDRLHAARHSMFTTQLRRHVDAFLPSRLDPVLKQKMFPSLMRVRSLTLSNDQAENELKRRAFTILERLAQVEDTENDVFAVDNTNSIESHFNVVKLGLSCTYVRLLIVSKLLTSQR